MVVRFTTRIDTLGVVNGTIGKLESIERGRVGNPKLGFRLGNSMLATSFENLSGDKGRVPLRHAYATTLYAVQGATVDKAFVLVSDRMT